MCEISEPLLALRVDQLAEPLPYPCGNTQERYPDEREQMDWQAELRSRIGVAPESCGAAVEWFQTYLQSVEQAALTTESSLASRAVAPGGITAAYARLGVLLEQGNPRADAVRASCSRDPEIGDDEALGVLIAMNEIESGFNEAYRTFVAECVAHGGVDCGVLSPTAKQACEENWIDIPGGLEFLLNAEAVELFGLDGWPGSAYGIACVAKQAP